MTTLREAAQQALDALNEVTGWQSLAPQRVMDEVENALAALRAALEQPEQEPEPKPCPTCQALARAVMMDQTGYDMPPLRQLTDEVIADLWARNGTFHHHFARAIERWLKGQA
jgi:hypothetical protein